ncbi:ASCH domain-containing protein [Rhizobium lusitanum]|uniref:ASCH domain-containing protein n=1 Tax=Rhizobium lusitanum TaxID=293958 RepID=UPI0019585E4F|nr:ASCH domain-containing protein [Rhizobium lusitanum]MBM7046090.1 hypothetical protein [Rhizobium lusitanum]
MMYPGLPLKALSVRQPWAHSILYLGKPYENRSWNTSFRGHVCLHAAKGMTADEWEDGFFTARAAAEISPFPEGTIFPGRKQLQFGGIVGIVEIVDVITESDSAWFFGPFGFVLRNPEPVHFIPVKGALGFFDWRRNLEMAA